jgi:acetyl-CoA carboxylase carboxyltransferase component
MRAHSAQQGQRFDHCEETMISGTARYHWITTQRGEHRFLEPVFTGLGCARLHVWIDAEVTNADFRRTDCHGLITAIGEVDGRRVAVAWSDFRVEGAAFGHRNSRRFTAFINQIRTEPGSVPLIYFVNSTGVSLMAGRAAFSDGFGIWPALLEYSEQHLLLTCAVGKCLGLAPLLFGLGHYRVAVADGTQLNLTGPEVIRMFFGNGTDYERSAGAERCHETNDLIHEIVPTVATAWSRFRNLLRRTADSGAVPVDSESPTGELLARCFDGAPAELVPGWCPRLRLFLGTRGRRPFGVFVNPLERSDNMITVRTLEKYAAGLDLMSALRVPIVSFLDSPGVDPRFDQSDAGNIRKMLCVGEKIIRYPWGSLGVVTRRCFGGASTLAFPKVFGGARMLALQGATIGTMNEKIIARLLGGSPRLLERWKRSAVRQGPGMEDLIAEGSLDAVTDLAGLPREIDHFLAAVVPTLGKSRRAPVSAPRVDEAQVLPFPPRDDVMEQTR